MMANVRDALEGAKANAGEAAGYLDHTRDELAELIRQAGTRERTAKRLRDLMAHIIAAGILTEQAEGFAQVGIEFLGGKVELEPLRFAGDIGKPAVTS